MNNNKSDPRPMIKYNATKKQMEKFKKNLKAWEARQATKKMKKEQNNYASKQAANAAKKTANNARTRILNSLFTNTPARPAPSFGHSPANPPGYAPAFGHQAAYGAYNNNAAPGIEGVDFIYNSNGNVLWGDEMTAYLQANPTTSSLPTFGRSRRNRRRATRKNRRASRKTRRINRK